MISACPAVQYSLLHRKAFTRAEYLALLSSNNDFSANMEIPSSLSKDFQWWSNVFSNRNQSNPICSGTPVREIFLDASLSGWGAFCGDLHTNGWWSDKDKTRHINLLELKAAFYVLRCVALDLRNCEVLLRIDNTAVIACINRFGSVRYPHLMSTTKLIWEWCESRNIFIFAS